MGGRMIAWGTGGLVTLLAAGIGLLGGSQAATAASGGPPDLGMARLSDIKIDKLADGRRVLRFSTVIVNVGAGVFEVGGSRSASQTTMQTIVQRVYDGSGGSTELPVPTTMVFGGDGHNHWHLRDLESSELIRLDNGSKVGTGTKLGYCFFDNYPYRLTLPGAPQTAVYTGCGTATSLQVTTGLSVGWGDIYRSTLPDQFVDITGLSAGRYRLVVTADKQNWFTESNESNNETWVELQLKGQGPPRILAYGPAA
jgi:hypothetical protein